MLFWEWIFFTGIFAVFYNYVGYAIITYILVKLRPRTKPKVPDDFYPTVSFIVAAYNEQDIIEKKIQNSFELEYPADKIEYIFITDGSSDNSPSIIQNFPGIRLLHSPERRGKSAALNRSIALAKNDILIISDANTFLNKEAIKYITSHYIATNTGGVAGEKKVLEATTDKDNVGSREGLYWKYESFLKKIDSEFYSVVGAAGELFSVRRDLYENVPDSTLLDDFVISLKVAEKGFRVIYEPRAYAAEFASVSIEDEKKRKVRIAAGGFQSMIMLSSLLKFWKHPKLTFLYVSHRVLRWTLSPLSLILVFIANLVLIFQIGNAFYIFFFISQVLFYLIAIISSFISGNSPLKSLKFAGYFVFMNVSVVQGFFRFFLKKQTVAWEKAKRITEYINIEK